MQTDGAEARQEMMGKPQLFKFMKIMREGAYKRAKQEAMEYRTAQDNPSPLKPDQAAATDHGLY